MRSYRLEPDTKIHIVAAEACPRCNRSFAYMFLWPGVGTYCWPCYHETGDIYVMQEAAAEAEGGQA